ncbi:MAG: transporter [Xanthobacteraceae bacterium]
MIQAIETSSSEARFSEAQLLLEEFSHRINNELSSAISMISIAAARSAANETKCVLSAVRDQLFNYAELHHALQMPEHSTPIDGAAYLRQLCRAISRSKLDGKGIELLLVGRKFLANIGIGHGAIDAGAGYTYFNPQMGHEFSAVGGFTYNLTNQATDYQNGVDFHLDMAASQFLSKQFFVGAVGYIYDQVSADRGSAPILGPIESRVAGIGPQAGYIFPVGGMQGVVNLKAYFEFDSHDRPDGWNTWVTFSISPPAPPAPSPPASRTAMINK